MQLGDQPVAVVVHPVVANLFLRVALHLSGPAARGYSQCQSHGGGWTGHRAVPPLAPGTAQFMVAVDHPAQFFQICAGGFCVKVAAHGHVSR